MNKVTIPFTVDLPDFRAFTSLVPELSFGVLANLAATGPFVYLLVEPRGGVIYVGKSDATTGAVGKRALAYAKWSSEYQDQVADGGRPDPLVDPVSGDLSLAAWSPIIRFVTRHQAIVHVASVAGTGLSGKLWEARLQGLTGTLTGLESLVGGSGWEAKPGTLRKEGYDWAWDRITQLRGSGALSG
ncbi:hypothetical protein [Cryobacterium luteum]|uniref:Uncharacterized protein n=1 Tax=Cryobacterium luteum TaxID=1424661 RepID=A0A1H8LXA2_9MICO|nr:hypothetical protein [Cryobacterium luteum]TFB86183.1 hypothetical protein E3O10_14410 [Cryobacterium luteum]SEO09528.1 hypothetical protein SAMN05216281_1334 [Cryobacterium luteum]